MINKCTPITLFILWVCFACPGGSAFSTPRHHSPAITHVTIKTSAHQLQLSARDNHEESSPLSSRREWTKSILSSLVTTTSAVAILGNSKPEPALAAESGDIIWKTGKAPIVPGQKPKDKGDTKGTKKDPNFLRSVSDCKGKCENSPGPDGLARSAAECLSACQDICCTTYEQCTFAIVPR